jgi:hypothetical protein
MRPVMKKMIINLTLLLPIGLMAILFQGCYTQFITMHDEDASYQEDQQYADQNDSTYTAEENDNWQSHPYLGFSYYYPGWRSYWSWDYGCVYPSYWDPWYWGSAYYVGYSYYPHHLGYWNSYPSYNHWGYGGHFNRSHSFTTRNSGYQRGGTGRNTYGATRSGNAGAGSGYNGQVGTTRGEASMPRAAGNVGSQNGSTRTTRSSRAASSSVSTGRQSNSSRYNPSVQQPRHREQNATAGRSYRTNGSHNNGQSRTQGSGGGQSRSSERSSAPSYTPQPSARTSSAPSSSPSPRSDGGGGRQSGGSGRSR